MASTGLDFINELEKDCAAVKTLNDFIWKSVLQYGSLGETVRIVPNLVNGKKLTMIGELDDVGQNKSICKGEYNTTNLTTDQKEWRLCNFVVREQLCSDDWEGTVVEPYLGQGNEVGDMTGTYFVTDILRPALTRAIEKGYWRVCWFGDTDAKTFENGGQISNDKATNIDKITVCDGLWKKVFDICDKNPSQRITIAANNEATQEAQYTAIFEEGVAHGIFKKVLYRAPGRLRAADGVRFLSTQSLADALAEDLKAEGRGCCLAWETLFEGFIFATRWNGQLIIVCPYWDVFIQEWQKDDSGKLFNPNRLIYTTHDNLRFGMRNSGLDFSIKMWFEEKDDMVYIKHYNKIGTLIADDELLMAAF